MRQQHGGSCQTWLPKAALCCDKLSQVCISASTQWLAKIEYHFDNCEHFQVEKKVGAITTKPLNSK